MKLKYNITQEKTSLRVKDRMKQLKVYGGDGIGLVIDCRLRFRILRACDSLPVTTRHIHPHHYIILYRYIYYNHIYNILIKCSILKEDSGEDNKHTDKRSMKMLRTKSVDVFFKHIYISLLVISNDLSQRKDIFGKCINKILNIRQE